MITKLDVLFEMALKEEVDIEYVSFPSNILGLYYKEDGIPPVIGINKSIISTKKLFTCVLSEEFGHHFTTIGDTTAEYYSYTERLLTNKKEILALKWATEFLLPLNEVIDAFKPRVASFSEIADQLQVTDQFLLKRFEFLAKYNQYIKISNDAYLHLSSLPNIYISKLDRKSVV